MGRTAARKPHLDFLTITTEYNLNGVLHAIIWTPAPLKGLQVTRTAARKSHLGSLTNKEDTGDTDCMQASFGLSNEAIGDIGGLG